MVKYEEGLAIGRSIEDPGTRMQVEGAALNSLGAVYADCANAMLQPSPPSGTPVKHKTRQS